MLSTQYALKLRRQSHVTDGEYQSLYRRSLKEPEEFWAEQAESYLTWFQKWNRVMSCDFRSGQIQWFDGGLSMLLITVWTDILERAGNQDAIIWEGDELLKLERLPIGNYMRRSVDLPMF